MTFPSVWSSRWIMNVLILEKLMADDVSQRVVLPLDNERRRVLHLRVLLVGHLRDARGHQELLQTLRLIRHRDDHLISTRSVPHAMAARPYGGAQRLPLPAPNSSTLERLIQLQAAS